MGKATTLVLTFVVLSALAPAAAVARVVAPPGQSEADQYFQTLPGSAGPETPDTSRGTEDAVREGALPPTAAAALRARGGTGNALAGAVAMTAPRGGGAGANGGGGSGEEAPEARGLGPVLPLLLVATGVAAAGFALSRRRRSSLA